MLAPGRTVGDSMENGYSRSLFFQQGTFLLRLEGIRTEDPLIRGRDAAPTKFFQRYGSGTPAANLLLL